MRVLTAVAAMALLVLASGRVRAEAGDAQAAVSPPARERPAHFKLVDAAPSIDALLGRLLDALASSDVDALHRLRMTEAEYRTFVLPGSVEPGQPARVYEEGPSEWAWHRVDTNSQYAAAAIIKGYGGRRYTLKEVNYLKGHGTYAWYDAYRTVSLTLEDEKGQSGELVLGSIANIDGQFKFISLLGNP
jgi:hypothetical protein